MNVFDYFFENSKHLKKDFVVGNRERVSYDKLYSDSLKVAAFLKENYGEGKNILLIGQNSVFLITAYLGILKSGNVCVPLDFSIESQNLEYIRNLTESSVIFCDKRLRNKLDLKPFETVLDEFILEEILSDKEISSFDSSFSEERLAEIIFTSGSTGKPKGVMLNHRNLKANTSSIVEYLKLTTFDRVLVVLPFYYCYGLSLLHTHLRVGGSIVLNNSFMFLGTVISDLNKFECTGFSGVPSHFQLLLKKSTSFKTTKFPKLRYVTQAGGKLHNVFIEEFVAIFPEIDFYVMYGQTEATARLSYLPPEKIYEKLGSIGNGIPGVSLKVVDENGQEVAVGETGEIIAKGENIMPGYYKDTTASKKVLKNKWLYTGDLAKRDEEGYIYVVGRAKEIIKVGGKRVSPKEIEAVILQVPEVVDCSITAVDDTIQGEALLAEVVVTDMKNKETIKEQILRHCKENLALYKIPQQFKFESKMRVKSSGKK